MLLPENIKLLVVHCSDTDDKKKLTALNLKSKYKIVKEFSINTDQTLKKKKKIKYRGSAKSIFKSNV